MDAATLKLLLRARDALRLDDAECGNDAARAHYALADEIDRHVATTPRSDGDLYVEYPALHARRPDRG